MPKTNIHILQRQIDRSCLLTHDRKERLQNVISKMSPEQLLQLSELLGSEADHLASLTQKTISDAVEKGEGGILKEFDQFIGASTKALTNAQEGAERSDEETHVEHLFDVSES